MPPQPTGPLNLANRGSASPLPGALQQALQTLGKVAADTAGQVSRLNQVVRGPFEILNRLTSAIGANVAGFVAKFSPNAIKQFQIALDDLHATIGEALTPVLRNFTVILRSVGSGINSLNGPAKALAAGLAAASVGFVVAAGAIELASIALNSALAGIPAVLGAVASGFAGMFVALRNTDGVKQVIDKVVGAMTAAFNAVAPAVGQVFRALAPLVDLITTEFSKGMVLFADAIGLAAKGLAVAVPMMVNFVKQLGLLRGPLGYLFDLLGYTLPKLADNTGKAVRSTQTSDIGSYIRQQYEKAFAVGVKGKDDPIVKSNNKLEAALMEVAKKIDEWITEIKKRYGQAEKVAGGLAGGVVGSGIAGSGFNAAETLWRMLQRQIHG